MKHAWWKEAVVYQIYPRSFKDSNGDGIGDLNGIIEKLDYLKELGIDVIWLSPVYKSPNDDNGYDISDYQDIMDEFGTLEDWENLLAEMHKRGIKLIMDLVVNHTSDEHKWFIESRKSKDNPYRDYYIWNDGKEDGKLPPNNWHSRFEFGAWEYDENTKQYYLHQYSKKMPDLNWENPKVHEEVFKMMKFWLDKGIDGFRMDVINRIGKPDNYENDTNDVCIPDENKAHKVLQEMNREVLSKYDIMTVGETPDVTPQRAALFTDESRHELNMVFHFEHMFLEGTRWTTKRFRLTDLKRVMSKWQTELPETAWNSLYLDNHDQPRQVSRFGDDGKYRVESAKMLATMLHTQRGTPYIYQGEEIGMTNAKFTSLSEYKDIRSVNTIKVYEEEKGYTPEEILAFLIAKSRDNARTPVQWTAGENAGFSTAKPWMSVNPDYKEINVEAALKDPNSIFYYYQKLIKLRHQHDIIVYGDFTEYFNDSEQVYVYKRVYENQEMMVFLNFAKEDVTLDLPETLDLAGKELLIANYEGISWKDRQITLKPYQATVLLGNKKEC